MRRRTEYRESRVLERLLHAVADGVVVVLGLDDGDRDVRLVVENVVGALGLAAGDQLAADDDAALGELTSSRICDWISQPAVRRPA